MNKKIKNILTLFFFLLFAFSPVQASLLYEIDYGIKEFKKGKFENSKKYFLKYIKSNPNDKDGYYWLAKTYSNLNDNKNATLNFQKAYELTFEEKNIEKIDFNLENISNLEDYFDMAVMYFENGKFKEAKAYANLMLEINPKSPSAYFIKAKIAQTQGNNEEAVQFLNNAITFNNKLIKTNLAKSLNITKLPQLSDEMYEVFALESYFSSDITTAIKYARKYLDLNPENYEMTNLLIDLYIKNDEIILAQSLIDKILKENENNIQTLIYQAQLYKNKDDLKQETTLLNAYKINPNNQQVLLELGNFYLAKADFQSARKYFEILINVNDELYEGYFGYIYSIIELGKTNEAMGLIRKIASLNENFDEIDYLLAKICAMNGDYKAGYDYISQAIIKNKNSQYFLLKSKINYVLKNYNEAILDLENAIENLQNENSVEIENELIKNYLKNYDKNNAQKLLAKKQGLDKNLIMYKYNLYVLHKLQGNDSKAQNQLNELKKIKPIIAKDYIDLSQIYYEQGEIAQAFKILDKAIKKMPKEAGLYAQKNKLYFMLSKEKEKEKTTLQMQEINP